MFFVMWAGEAGRGSRRCDSLDQALGVLDDLGVPYEADKVRLSVARGVWRATVTVSGVRLTVSVRR